MGLELERGFWRERRKRRRYRGGGDGAFLLGQAACLWRVLSVEVEL